MCLRSRLCAIVILIWVNCYSVRLSAAITNVLTFGKLIALGLIIIMGFIEIFKGKTLIYPKYPNALVTIRVQL